MGSSEPLYPYSITARYRYICPKGASGECDGFIQYRTRHTIAVLYCHDRVCPELFPELAQCPCKNSDLCRGSHWNNDTFVCNRRELIEMEVVDGS